MPTSVYAGGYSEEARRRLDAVIIPDKVKCKTCKKIRMQSAFSKRQLDLTRNAIALSGPKAAINGPLHATCRNCVGGQVVELRCSGCDRSKPLEEFARSQRGNRDTVRCLSCVQHHTDIDPLLEEQKHLAESELSTIQGTTVTSASQANDGSTIGSVGRYTIENAPSQYSREGSVYRADDEDDDFSVGGGVWLETARSDENSTKNKGKPIPFTGYDAQGNPHRRSVQPGAPGSVHSGWASMGISPRSNPPAPPKKKVSKFAKVPGNRPSENAFAPRLHFQEPTGEAMPSDDEDDDGIEDFL